MRSKLVLTYALSVTGTGGFDRYSLVRLLISCSPYFISLMYVSLSPEKAEKKTTNLVQTLQFFQRINCLWTLCANFRHHCKLLCSSKQ